MEGKEREKQRKERKEEKGEDYGLGEKEEND